MLKSNRKSSLDTITAFSIVITSAFGTFVLLVLCPGESMLSFESLQEYDQAIISKAYMNFVATHSCIIAENSIGSKKTYFLNMDFINSLPQHNPINCITIDGFKYELDIVIYDPLSWSIISTYTFNNTEVSTTQEFKEPVKYYAVTPDGLPAEILFRYVNYEEN